MIGDVRGKSTLRCRDVGSGRDAGGRAVGLKRDGALFKRKIRTRLDLLSIPHSGEKNVKTFMWDHRLQIQNFFMAYKRVPVW